MVDGSIQSERVRIKAVEKLIKAAKGTLPLAPVGAEAESMKHVAKARESGHHRPKKARTVKGIDRRLLPRKGEEKTSVGTTLQASAKLVKVVRGFITLRADTSKRGSANGVKTVYIRTTRALLPQLPRKAILPTSRETRTKPYVGVEAVTKQAKDAKLLAIPLLFAIHFPEEQEIALVVSVQFQMTSKSSRVHLQQLGWR